MKAALYSQKSDLDTFLYLSRFISELDSRGVEVVLEAGIAEKLQFSKNFTTFSDTQSLAEQKVDLFLVLEETVLF